MQLREGEAVLIDSNANKDLSIKFEQIDVDIDEMMQKELRKLMGGMNLSRPGV